MMEELGNRAGVAVLLHDLGILHQRRGEYAESLARYEQSLQISEELGDRNGIAHSLHQLGTLQQLRGEYAAALAWSEQSLRIREELDDHAGVAESLANIGNLLMLTGQYTQAFHPLMYALETFLQLQSPNARVAATMLRTLRARWGEQAFDAAWREVCGEELPGWLTDESEATLS
jgi:tetratricopeptide (TPR) repeat protein